MKLFPESSHVLSPDCQRCSELVSSRERIVWGTGSLHADIMVIGEAPGAGDPSLERWRGGNWTGMAYTTRHSGWKIRKIIDDMGYFEVCYFTNAVKCFPGDCSGSNREPTASELRNCSQHLQRELRLVDPKILLPTGKHATEAVFSLIGLDVKRFLDLVLKPVNPDTYRFHVIPLLHPSYDNVWIQRIGYTREGYLRELKKLIENLMSEN